ncbi:dTDP-4-dehydrorhamnose reductase [uncultured Maritimibacter sp.]|uniref:dTDP-4-dehydrorhamnose reductase n=1 Tax=uncultured Maritimibacter sp. TaxID=991866 RepID=UPI0025927CAF|nr:dTDP-4-dehydrorhamnose reductase [uncultured Maritimibacter sp.]
MKALVFGTTGQVARELASTTPKGVTLEALGRDRADLSRPTTCAEAIRHAAPDVVINAAAFTAVDRAEEDEALATVVNGEAPGEMARACAALGIPFLHVSTDYVFSGEGDAPWAVDAPTRPLNAYGRSKLAGETAIRAAGGPHAILRTSWVVSGHGGNFVKTMLRLSETRDRLTIVADQIGGPTPASDIAAALWSMAVALVADPSKGGTYHYSGAPDVSWADFAREIFRQSGRTTVVEDIATKDYPTPAKRPTNSRLDCSATEAAFGVVRPDWRVGLTDILNSLTDKAS